MIRLNRYYYSVTILRDNQRDERAAFDTLGFALKWVETIRSFSDYKIIIERRCNDALEK